MLKDLRQCFSIRTNARSLYCRASERDAALDGIRAISILLLVFFHSANITAFGFKGGPQAYIDTLPRNVLWLMQADKGVDIFFVLSGFLIGRLLMQEYARNGHLRIGRFYLRRILRLCPAYAVLLTLLIIVPMNQSKWYLLANLFYVNNYLSLDKMFAPWTWSLAVEEQFYLLLPLFLMLTYFNSRKPTAWLIALIAVAPIIRYCVLLGLPEVLTSPYIALATNESFLESYYDNLHTRYDALLIGVLAAHVHLNSHHLITWLSRHDYASSLMAIGSIGGIVLILWLPLERMHDQWPLPAITLFQLLHRSVFAVLIATLMLAALHGNGIAAYAHRVLSSRLLLPFGQLAYSMFLFHIPFVILMHLGIKTYINDGSTQFSPDQLWLLAALSLIPSSLFSCVVYLGIEKPIMNIRDRFVPAIGDKQVSGVAFQGKPTGFTS